MIVERAANMGAKTEIAEIFAHTSEEGQAMILCLVKLVSSGNEAIMAKLLEYVESNNAEGLKEFIKGRS